MNDVEAPNSMWRRFTLKILLFALAIFLFTLAMFLAVGLYSPRIAAVGEQTAEKSARVELIDLAVEQSEITITFAPDWLEGRDWTVASTRELEPDLEGAGAILSVVPGARVTIETSRGRFAGGVYAQLSTLGGWMMGGQGSVLRVPNPTLRGSSISGWRLECLLGGDPTPVPLFTLSDVQVEFGQTVERLSITGSLVFSPRAAEYLGDAALAGRVAGEFHLEAVLALADDTSGPAIDTGQVNSPALASSVGADVIVGDLHTPSPSRRGTVGSISAYSFGTTACNIGDAPIGWIAMTSDSPVIGLNLYRLRNGGFEQIGLSWLKYGFSLSTGNLCNPQTPCVPVPMHPDLFPPGCSDVYSASTNAFQGNLAPRWTVNPVTGEYVYMMPPPVSSAIERLMQVNHSDLEPDFNGGARYFAESQYITHEDAAAGNQDNNASYREVIVVELPPPAPPNTYNLLYPATSATRREKPGILAWQEVDPAVGISYIDVPGDRRLILGYRVIDAGGGIWHYEYAVQNLNSDRGAMSFAVPIPDEIVEMNVGFHDIADHSGAPFDTTDWNAIRAGGAITWTAPTSDPIDNANALRWGSLYSFRFTTDTPPKIGQVTLGLFKPGTPSSMLAPALVPARHPIFTTADPPDGSIDARQPSQPDGSNPVGWELVIWNCVSVQTCAPIAVEDFLVTQDGGSGTPPVVIALIPVAGDILGVLLKHAIAEQAWTTVAAIDSDDQVRLGYLPGDVDADGVSGPDDATALVAVLISGSATPIWSTDIDRSNVIDAEDVVREMDLLNGAEAFTAYLNVALPANP